MKSFQKEKEVVTQPEAAEKLNIKSSERAKEHSEEKVISEISFPTEFTIPDDWPPTTSTAKLPENVESSILPESLFPSNIEALPSISNVESLFETDPKFDRGESPELQFPSTIDNYEKLEDIKPDEFFEVPDGGNLKNVDKAISLMKIKNNNLLQLRENLIRAIQVEHKEIDNLQVQLKNKKFFSPVVQHSENLDKVMDLLQKENQILQIKKINLVRQIIEQQEICIDYKSKIELCNNLQK